MSSERRRIRRPAEPLFARLHELGPERMREALALEKVEARQAGALGFLARTFVQATLPHRRCDQHEFERTNGHFTLHLHAPPSVGLPYGSYPRLILAWLNTEAVRKRSPHLQLGPTFTSFMHQIGVPPITGKRGTSARLRDQLHRLFSTSIRCTDSRKDLGHAAGEGYMLTRRHDLWWAPQDPHQAQLWQSTVSLSTDFYNDIVEHAVPVDLRALRILKRSALALDIYAWLTYRLSYLSRPTRVPWEALQAQFGAAYARRRDFRRRFLRHLVDVLQVYPSARVSADEKALTLSPADTHIRRLSRR